MLQMSRWRNHKSLDNPFPSISRTQNSPTNRLVISIGKIWKDLAYLSCGYGLVSPSIHKNREKVARHVFSSCSTRYLAGWLVGWLVYLTNFNNRKTPIYSTIDITTMANIASLQLVGSFFPVANPFFNNCDGAERRRLQTRIARDEEFK